MNTTIASEPRITALLVADAMHVGVLTCDRDAPLSDVAATMARERVHCVVVASGSGEAGDPWGIVSDLDLVAAATVRDLDEQTKARCWPALDIAAGAVLLASLTASIIGLVIFLSRLMAVLTRWWQA